MTRKPLLCDEVRRDGAADHAVAAGGEHLEPVRADVVFRRRTVDQRVDSLP